jgi:hypothetical protein
LKSALEEAIMAGIDPAIGGDVAAIVLQRGALIRCFSRPQACRTW